MEKVRLAVSIQALQRMAPTAGSGERGAPSLKRDPAPARRVCLIRTSAAGRN